MRKILRGDHLGLETGFAGLDLFICGMHPGQIIVVGGRPNMGDTDFITNIAVNVAIKGGKRVVFLSLKNNQVKVAGQMTCAASNLGLPVRGFVNNRSLQDDHWGELTVALEKLSDANIDILDNRKMFWTALGIESSMDVLGDLPNLLVIDGAQMLDVTNTATSYDRNIQLGEQFRQLKKMALVLGIPILMTVSLNRDLENRVNKRPMLKDIRDVGMLEDIADVILFLYRDEMYNGDSVDRGVSEVIVAKQQHGPLGTILLHYEADKAKYKDVKEQ